LTVEDLKLDRVERRVERGGRRIDLTGKEFALLEYLMRNAGRRITRAMIIEHVWNLSFDTCTNVVDVYVNYQLQVNLPGAQVFNGPADTFVAINDLITSMYSNTGIGAAVTELGNALTHVSGQQAFYGNALNQTQSQQTYLNTQSVGLSQQENTVAAADLTSVASQLVNDQTAQTAALEAIGRRPQTSLFDYLK
jgi:flagellin-like hook-associated protein FlgL